LSKAFRNVGYVAVTALVIVVVLIVTVIVVANLSEPPRNNGDGETPSMISSDSHFDSGAETGAESASVSTQTPGNSAGGEASDAAQAGAADPLNPGAVAGPGDNGGALGSSTVPDPGTPTSSPPPASSPAPIPSPSPAPTSSPTPAPSPIPSPIPSPAPAHPNENAPAPDTTAPTGVLASDPGIQPDLDRIAERFGAVGVQVAVITNGEITGTYCYGYATKGAAPMTVATKIRSASLSKVALAMVIMQLAEDNEISIDADIGEYWGMEIRNPNHRDAPITMRQFLSHTSSITVNDNGYYAPGEQIRRRLRDGTCFDGKTPGDIGSWNYNNYGFAVLGLTVEFAVNETVNSIAARRLFAPLGIDSAFGPGSISDTGRLATLYTYGGGVGRSTGVLRNDTGNSFPGESGGDFPGGLTISAYDYAKLIAVLANRGEYGGVRVMSPRTVSLMESPQGRAESFDQCLAIRRIRNLFGEDELFYHTGSNYGVFTLASYDPVNRSGVVVFTSGADGRRDSVGVPVVCAEFSEYIYKLIKPSQESISR